MQFCEASDWKYLLWPLTPREEAEGTQGWVNKGRTEAVRCGNENEESSEKGIIAKEGERRLINRFECGDGGGGRSVVRGTMSSNITHSSCLGETGKLKN